MFVKTSYKWYIDIMNRTTPRIKTIDTKIYEVKHSQYENVSKLPMRAMLSTPSGGSQTVLLQHMIFDMYKVCVE